LLKFEKRKPALIAPRGAGYFKKEINGMTFDPQSMQWVGNEDCLNVFHGIDVGHLDDGFAVGTEFSLTTSLIKSFMDCASRHKATLSGWSSDVNDKSYLYAIRRMSILRVVQDVKQQRHYLSLVAEDAEMSDLDMAVPERDVPGQETDGEADSYDDIPLIGSARLKLPYVDEAEDWNIDEEESKPSVTPKREDKEEWDEDFAEDDGLQLKITKMPNVEGKVVNLGALHQQQQQLQHHQQHHQAPQNVEDDDEFELPPGPLLLVPSKKNVVEVNDIDEEEGTQAMGATEDVEVVEDEDWGDVAIPSTLPEPITLRSVGFKQQHQEREEWNDFDQIPEKLTLKANGGGEKAGEGEEAWEDVDIPDNFITRMRKSR